MIHFVAKSHITYCDIKIRYETFNTVLMVEIVLCESLNKCSYIDGRN